MREGANRDLIDPIWALNSLPEDKKPEFSVEDVTFKSIEEITTSLKDMAASGAVLSPDDPAINDVRDLLGVSRYEPSAMMMGAAMPVPGTTQYEDQILEEQPVDKRRVTRRRIRVGRNRS